ncbi:MAG TPA: tetratricopeptide repeat protein [Gemmataceae bacterium]|nr:tetratricopeptide repeat protein [Gemmataceae bacterium]
MPIGFGGDKGRHQVNSDLRFEMTNENEQFYQTAIQRTADGERRVKWHLDLVYGANKADQVFFSWRGNRLYELMTVWVDPWNRWANTPYDTHGVGDFAREATTRCLECHNTWFQHVPGTLNEYKPESFVLGVTCERCHGPANEHVQYHRAHPESEAAHAIIHPGHLSRDRLTEVCTQCHGNLTKARGPALSYRPGEPLESTYRTARTRHPEEDHVANQIKYLRQSKCFQKSDTLTCVTCHDPHRPHEAADSISASKSCFKCHQREACSDRPNLPVAVRDDCVGCHMAPRVWMNVHFHTADDRYAPPIRRYQHRITKDPVARTEVLLAWRRTQSDEASRKEAERLTRELTEYWLGECRSRRQENRLLAAIGAAREALRLDPPAPARAKAADALADATAVQTRLDLLLTDALRAASENRHAAAIQALNEALEIKPDWAVAHSKLGTLYAMTGRIDRATSHLEAVARHDPDNASGLAMLGWLAYLAGRVDDAVDLYRRADEIEPYDAKIHYHWGLAYMQLGNWLEAVDRFRRVLTIDPNHAGGCQGLAHALGKQGKAADAVRYAWRAARLTGFREPDVLVTLADAYSAVGRVAEAAAAATKAIELDIVGPAGSRLTIETRHRMEDLRTLAR